MKKSHPMTHGVCPDDVVVSCGGQGKVEKTAKLFGQ
jgi:hypothetical protein